MESKKIFRIYWNNNNNPIPVLIKTFKEEKVSDLINRYKIKANEKRNNIIYKFKGKILNQNLTVSEVGITNNSNIFVIEK